MTATVVDVETYEVDYEVSVEVDDGTILTATGPTLAGALRALADMVEAHR